VRLLRCSFARPPIAKPVINSDRPDIHQYKSGSILVNCHLLLPITANSRVFDDFARIRDPPIQRFTKTLPRRPTNQFHP
jgi:hypothetical protein